MSSFLTTTVNVLKKVLMIGAQSVPVIVSAYNAPLGALLGTLLASITTVESQGNAKGDAKRDAALAIVQAALPAIEQIFVANNKAIKNPDLFAAGVGKLQDGLVDILNSTGEGTK
jgi:hypothetical protein